MENDSEDILHRCKTYVCSVCDKIFSQSGNLATHKKIAHSEEKPHKCSTCGKRFKLRSYLTVHLRIHSVERPYSCTLCDKSFRHSSNLASHMKTHSMETPHECTTCGKSFKMKCYLTRHLERWHVNSVCEKTCNQPNSLSDHNRTCSGKGRVVSRSCVNEEKYSKEIPSRCQILSPSTECNRAEGMCLPSSSIEKCSGLHSAPTPFIINIKTEDDI